MTALQDYKVKASLLLKAAKQGDAVALQRFAVVPGLTPDTLQRKHALRVIALENGFASWLALKLSQKPSLETLLRPRGAPSFLNDWHTDYDVAKKALESSGGYLLPYKSQFFIVQRGYIEALGLNPDDADWQRMGFDAVKPKDRAAWERLRGKLELLHSSSNLNKAFTHAVYEQ